MGIEVKVRLDDSAWIEFNRKALWRAVRKVGADGASFTAAEVAKAAKVRRHRDVLAFLAQAADEGRLSVVGGGVRSPRFVIRTTERAADRPSSPAAQKQQNMWNVLAGKAGRDGVSVEDLVMLASTRSLPLTVAEASAYIAALVEGHFLLPRGEDHFFLPAHRRTGLLAPLLMSVRIVIDQNNWSVCRGEAIAQEVLP